MDLRKQIGLTLIELLIAVIILGVLLALGVPAFQDAAERRRIQGAVEQVEAQIALARSEAVKRNEPVSVMFMWTDADNWCFGARNDDTAGCDCEATAAGTATTAEFCGFDDDFSDVSDAQTQIVSMSTGDGIELDALPSFGGDAIFVFDPVQGTLASVADAGNLVLRTDEGNYEMQINLNGIGSTNVCYTADGKKLGAYEACP